MTSDRFDITLPHAVTVGNKVLQAGNYSVKPLNMAGGDAPVLTFRAENGMIFKTSAMVSPTAENRLQPETRVVLRRVGRRYYFDTIWVQGLAYGYRFPAPKNAKTSFERLPMIECCNVWYSRRRGALLIGSRVATSSSEFAQLAARPLEPELGATQRKEKELYTMTSRSFTFAASALVLGLATMVAPSTIQAQPLWDRVDVNLPYTVQIGDKTLQPGNYVIQQLDSPSGGSQVLLIYGDNGMKFETSALTIPALQNRTQPDTRVVLHHIGSDYYFDKVWIQGKDYGYEFPLPNSVKQRENEAMQPVSVAAKASSVPPANAQTTTQPTTTAKTTTPAATTQPATTARSTVQQQTTQPATTARQTTQPATTMQQTTQPATTSQNTANRAETMPPSSTPAMPHTDAGWLMMVLSGGTLSGLGLSLRRKRR